MARRENIAVGRSNKLKVSADAFECQSVSDQCSNLGLRIDSQDLCEKSRDGRSRVEKWRDEKTRDVSQTIALATET